MKDQDPDYISEIIAPLSLCYEKIGNEQELIDYLKDCLVQYPRISLVLALSEHLRKLQGDRVAIDFISDQIRSYPSLRAVGRLIELYLHNSTGGTRDKLSILQGLVEKKALYPITIFKSVSNDIKEKLFKAKVVLAKDLADHKMGELREKTGLDEEVLNRILKEANAVCGRKEAVQQG